MNKIITYTILFLLFLFFTNCSFDDKTGIWSGNEEEIRRLTKLEKESKEEYRTNILSTTDDFTKEIKANKVVNLGPTIMNRSWVMSGLNLQNSLGNLYLKSIQQKIVKKRIGKDKFDMYQKMHSPLFFQNNIVISDDTGSIYKISKQGRIFWKTNIYKKIHKKIYKNLIFTLYNNNIYVADNIGFVYVLDYKNGKVIWNKNFGIPFKSNIKVFDNRIFIIDQDNRILCLDVKNGSKIWDIRTIETFIKSQKLLGLAISKKGDLITINSAGDVLKIDTITGGIYWSMNSLISLSSYNTDFFRSSDIVINEDAIIFSNISSTFSVNINNGYVNWRAEPKSSNTPIIDGNNVFLITDIGYLVNLDKKTGRIIWSTNTLKILKKKRQLTGISGFVMGSGKIYITTENGYLIVCSATTGKVEYHKRIAASINASPIISNGELYVLTGSSRILGFK